MAPGRRPERALLEPERAQQLVLAAALPVRLRWAIAALSRQQQ
jgi:hypothetical protein